MNLKTIEIEKFLDAEYSNSALYQCFRSIASYIDGLKPSSRKVVYTTRKQNIQKDFKVSRYASSVAFETEYLHGENSLQGVITNLTQDFTGSNNLPLLSPNGNFGTRFVPIPSAARYIYSKKSEDFDKIFDKRDDLILIQQEFEGNTIEPKFFVPIIPLILVNGSEGVGTGFAQKILPRNPDDIKKSIKEIIQGKKISSKLIPFYKGFNGKIIPGETPNSWMILGTYEKVDLTTIRITEIPIGYSLSSYLKILKNLEEKGTIKTFEDLSEDDHFLFEVKVLKSFMSQSDEAIFEKLRLIKRVSENFTCIDEDNKIRIFSNAQELLESYFSIRLEYYEKRKICLIEQIEEELKYLASLSHFIHCIIKGEVIISDKSKKQIIEQLERIEKEGGICKKDGSFNYLLKIPIYSISKEKKEDILREKKIKEESLNYLREQKKETLWESDLKEFYGSTKKENNQFFIYS